MQVVDADDSLDDAGILESVTLKNFMCHSLLGPFKFGSNVNFIIGNNGSGKSAILTALIVALGGTAQATNRGSSLKGFVKEGESAADVSITLRNRGRDAYKPEVYGSVITIDQRISREGIRTYKLRSRSGQIISTKKEELLTILDNFNIQVDNPVSILTQEMSKHFLHSKGVGDKYRFFMKATRLEQMKEDFIHIKSTKRLTEDKMEQYAECLKESKRTLRERQDRYNSLASLDTMEAELTGLQQEMAWALVVSMEKELDPLQMKLQAVQRSTEKYDEKVEEWTKNVTEAEAKYRQIHEQLTGITLRLQELQPECAQLKTEAHRRNKLLKSGEVNVHRCNANLRDLEKDRAQLFSRIDELKLSISQASGAESQVRVERVDKIQADLANLTHQEDTLANQIDQYQQACNRANEELSKMRREYHGIQKSIEGNTKNLHTMEGSRSNRLRRFGEHMPVLLNAIEKAHNKKLFKLKPRGPLGYLFSLKDPELALAIEVCLKNQLQSFTCDNYDDEKVLQGIMSKVFPGGRRPSIITSSFLEKVHNTNRRSVNHPDYPSVLQALNIEDPVVANCLIDQRGIESILLIKDRKEARQVMQSKNPPKNCTQAFSQDGDQIFNNRSYTAEQTRANFLSGDVEEEIRHLQKELESQRAYATRFQQQIKVIEEDIKKNERLLKTAQMEQKKTKDEARMLELELTDIQNMEEPQSEDLKPLEEELQDVINKISAQGTEGKELKAEMANLKASYEEAEQEYKRHQEQISAVAEEADAIKEDLSKSDQEVSKSKHHKNHYEEKRKAHINNIEALRADLVIKEQKLAKSMAKAIEICPQRIEQCRTPKILDKEINRLKVKITTQQDQQGDRQEIIRLYHETRESYNKMAQQMKNLSLFVKTMKIMSVRINAYADLRRLLTARCKYHFHSLLSHRGYMGSITFDHKNETLSISVQPGEGDKADLCDMRSLSGGERSFSTVCFVLSLWSITESPFRCLDEFDVYMDMVNRRISMDMMLKAADSQHYRQFIFLTPQSMSSLPISDFIQILRLKDPDRGVESIPAGK